LRFVLLTVDEKNLWRAVEGLSTHFFY